MMIAKEIFTKYKETNSQFELLYFGGLTGNSKLASFQAPLISQSFVEWGGGIHPNCIRFLIYTAV